MAAHRAFLRVCLMISTGKNRLQIICVQPGMKEINGGAIQFIVWNETPVARVPTKRSIHGKSLMKKLLTVIGASILAISAASAQMLPQPRGSKADLLSLDQKTRISQLITKQAAPLTNTTFSIALDSIVPSDIELHSIPSEAEQVAPQLRGFGYLVIEELVAIVDPRTRKVEIVFPRWGE